MMNKYEEEKVEQLFARTLELDKENAVLEAENKLLKEQNVLLTKLLLKQNDENKARTTPGVTIG